MNNDTQNCNATSSSIVTSIEELVALCSTLYLHQWKCATFNGSFQRKSNPLSHKALIVQGGGFRTAFTAGVLDAFLQNGYDPFSMYIGVSGGAIAASYFVARQPGHCVDAIRFLAANKQYLDFTRVLNAKAVVDVTVFYDIANKHMPFDFDTALNTIQNKQMAIVMTNRETGHPHYYHPSRETWPDAIIASCAFPFISKGKHEMHGVEYMDGAWSDPLPVEWAVQQGATDITIIRTSPTDVRAEKSWLDTFGEIYYRNNIGLKTAFATNHDSHNRAVDFMNNPPLGITMRQIAPEEPLKAGVYTNSKALITEDYQRGFERGTRFCLQAK